MLSFLIIFFMGWLISLVGQLPLGNLSITATQISIYQGAQKAVKYAYGVALVEVLYLRFALSGMDWVYSHPKIFEILGWITVFLFFGIGVVNFIGSSKKHSHRPPAVLRSKLDKFVMGMLLSALNPAQFPFWVLWSGYMLQWKFIKQDSFQYNVFAAGGGAGTICGLYLYIYGGNYLFNKYNLKTRTLSLIVGGIFLLAGLVQLWGMIHH